MQRISKKMRAFIDEAREDVFINRTETGLLLTQKGKVHTLHSELTAEQMWGIYDNGINTYEDPFDVIRARICTFTSKNYDQISAYMACPARNAGPLACLSCVPDILVPCFMDNKDLLPEKIEMGIQDKLKFSTALAPRGYTASVLLKLPLKMIEEIHELVESGKLPDLSSNEAAKAVWDEIPETTPTEAESAAKKAVEQILALVDAPAEDAPPKKKKRGRPRKTPAPEEQKEVPVAAESSGDNGTPKPKKTRAKKTEAELDLVPVIAELGRLHSALSELTEHSSSYAVMSGALVGKLAIQQRAIQFLGERVLDLCQLVSEPNIIQAHREGWQHLLSGVDSVDNLEDLSDTELADMCKTKNAPATVLDSRGSMLGWLAS